MLLRHFARHYPGIAPTLAVGQQTANFLHISLVDDLILAEASFPFGGLFSQNMTGMGFPEFIFPGPGFFEPFGSCPARFDLRHNTLS
jgi:hypothetical protein